MSSSPGGSIRYLPTEVQSRFAAWAATSPLLMNERERLWAEYVDARDNLPPGSTAATTKARAQGESLVTSPKLYSLSRNSAGHVFK